MENELNGRTVREAKEVFIYMHRNFRASRNIRAHWYFHNLCKLIRIASGTEFDKDDEYSKEMSIVGIIPKNGDGTEDVGDELFLVTVDTKVTYISRYYRHVFVLDLSPSTVVADEESDCCLCTRLLRSLRNTITSSVKKFTIPGTSRQFQPQIYLSVNVFVPFLQFEHELTLLKGVLLTESNVESVLNLIDKKFRILFAKYYEFARPILRDWGKLKRRYKNYKFESFCENTSASDDYNDEYYARTSENSRGRNNDYRLRKQLMRHSASRNDIPEEEYPSNTMKYKRGTWKLEKDCSDQVISFTGDGGYILPEWALIFMLRTGLIATQMLPENTQSNLIVITDSVCGMPDANALQQVLTQLRSYTIACSFIQLQRKTCTEPVFGHVGSCELFHFLTMATFGTYLPKNRATPTLNDSRCSFDCDEALEESAENLNMFHRALVCWSFQNALADDEFMTNAFSDINPEFVDLQRRGVERHRRFMTTYTATLNQLMYVRLREGFTLKSAVFSADRKIISITLCLAFRPLVFIEYVIKCPWPVLKDKRQEIQVELIILAPYNELKDLLTEGQYLDPERLNLTKSAIDGIIEADRLLIHIHSFDTQTYFYTIPSGVTIDYALFSSYDKNARRLPPICMGKHDDNSTRSFIGFWRVLLELNDATWQKWVHTHSERIILNVPDLPFNMFTTHTCLEFDCSKPLNKLHAMIKTQSTFCLVNGHTYVTLVFEKNDDGTEKPTFFFMRRVCADPPTIIIKTAFLGGISSVTRRKLVEEHRERLLKLRFDDMVGGRMAAISALDRNEPRVESDKENVLNVIRRPLERMLVRYNDIPINLKEIVRVKEVTTDEEEIKLITLHNAIAKCLACKRTIIQMSTVEGAAYVIRHLTDYVMNVVMQRRLFENFKPAWTTNNIISVCRQVYNSSGNSLEQFIMFPATTLGGSEKNPTMKRPGSMITKTFNEPNAMPLKKTNRPMAIISEFWYEPEAIELVEHKEQLASKSVESRQEDDVALVSSLYTLDRVIRICGSCVDPNASDYTLHNLIDEELETHYGQNDCCRITSTNQIIGSKNPNDDKKKMRVTKISPFVTTFSNLYSFTNLVKHAKRKTIMVSEFVKDTDSPNYLLLHSMNSQLSQICDSSWPLEPEENIEVLKCLMEIDMTPAEVVENKMQMQVFAKGITPWMVGIVIVPTIAYGSKKEKEIPVIVLTCNEAQLAFSAARHDYDENGIVKVSIKDLGNEWFSNVRFGWRPNNQAILPENVRDFHTFVNYIEEDVLARTRMSAMFDAARKGVEIDEEKVSEMAIDVDFAELEMESVPQALQYLCHHLNCDDNSSENSPSREHICSKESNIDVMFSNVLAQNFNIVPGTRNMFYMKPSLTERKDKKKKRATALGIHFAADLVTEFTEKEAAKLNQAKLDLEARLMSPIPENEKTKMHSDNAIPLFIQFNCSIIFPDGTMDTFPIDFLPSCIYQVLGYCQKFPEEPYDIHELEVGVELLVMTSHRQIVRQNRSAVHITKKAYQNPTEFYRQTMSSRMKLVREHEEEVVHQDDKMEFVKDLPRKERRIVLDLMKSMNIVLELEKILVDSRTADLSMKQIDNVIEYINTACSSSMTVGYMERREKSLALVIKTEKAKKAFLDSLDGLVLDYATLRRYENTNTFYCRHVDNVERFIELKNAEKETNFEKDESGNITVGKDFLFDFWIIVNVDTNVTIHFCQRYEKQHSALMELLSSTVRQHLRTINQELLLERMYETRECDPLLISIDDSFLDAAAEPYCPSAASHVSLTPKPKRRRRSDSTPPIDDGMRFDFAPGYFACQLKKEIWFPVHQRLREMSIRQRQPPLAYSFDKLRTSLQEFGVRNIPNTYIVKDDVNNTYMYMQLHNTLQSYEQSIRNTRIDFKKNHIREAETRMETEIAMTIFSINEPNDTLVDQVADSMMQKLNGTLLTELLRGFSQNREQSLYVTEVKFLQPPDSIPFGHSFFSIPTIFGDYLSSLLYYINQHMQALNYLTPAKVKDDLSGSRNTSFSSNTFLPNVASGGSSPYRTSKFYPYQPFAGIVPPKFDLSSFYLYLKLPSAGVTSVGIGVVEFRMVTQEGYLIDRFQQPQMNEQSHALLVPNVPGDKSLVYRDIIKVQRTDLPKDSDKSISAYLEMIVWKQGDFEMQFLDSMMHEIIEMSMYDVITEFGYLNTNLMESGSNITANFALFRHSDVFSENPSEPNFFLPTQLPSTSSQNVAMSMDTKAVVEQKGSDMRRSIGGSMDMSTNTSGKTILSRLSSFAKDFEHSGMKEEFCSKRADYINRRTAYGVMRWFDFVASKAGDTNSVVKDTIRFECQHAILTPLFEIRNRIECELGGSTTAGTHENVFLCGLKKNDSEANLNVCSIRESNLSIFGPNCNNDGKFEVLTTDPFVEMKADLGVDESQNSQNEYLIVSYMKNVFSRYGESTVFSEDQVQEMIMLFRNHLHAKYEPLIQTHGFSPRQRIMFAMMKGELMTIYYYNFHPNILKEVRSRIHRIAGWHNSKTRLLREIGLHKMGITHLSPFNAKPQNDFDYEKLIWTDPTQLIAKEYPPDVLNIPSFTDLPEYSNIFFRMYRQPNLQITMGRSSYVFKSDCVPTNHYEQMLRWRDGLKCRLHALRKATNAHDELLKGKPEMKEEDLWMFLPMYTNHPKRVDGGRSRTDEDEETLSLSMTMTERTSKRASVHGDVSIKSGYIAESDIFKTKGTFIKKKVKKRKPAARFVKEIRTPLLVLETWRKTLYDKQEEEWKMKKEIETDSSEVGEDRKPSTSERCSTMPPASSAPSESVQNERDRSGIENASEAFEALNVSVNLTERQDSTEKKKNLFGAIIQRIRNTTKASEPSAPPSPIPTTSTTVSTTPPAIPTTSSPGAFSRARTFTLNTANRLVRPFRKLSYREKNDSFNDQDQIETGEDPLKTYPDIVHEEKPISEEIDYEEPPIIPILYEHAQDLTEYITKCLRFIRLDVVLANKRSRHLNRYKVTKKDKCEEPPYLIFCKIFEGGIIFVELSYEVPEFVLSFYVYERAKHSTVDFYMVEKMGKLYRKETEKILNEVELLGNVFNMDTFNYDYHLRVIARNLRSCQHGQESIYGVNFNVLALMRQILSYLTKYRQVRSRNIVEQENYKCTKVVNEEFWEKFMKRDQSPCVMLKMVLVRYQIDDEEEQVTQKNMTEYALAETEDTESSETGKTVCVCHIISCLPRYYSTYEQILPYYTIMVYLDDFVPLIDITDVSSPEPKKPGDENDHDYEGGSSSAHAPEPEIDLNSTLESFGDDGNYMNIPEKRQGKWWKRRSSKWSTKSAKSEKEKEMKLENERNKWKEKEANKNKQKGIKSKEKRRHSIPCGETPENTDVDGDPVDQQKRWNEHCDRQLEEKRRKFRNEKKSSNNAFDEGTDSTNLNSTEFVRMFAVEESRDQKKKKNRRSNRWSSLDNDEEADREAELV